MVRLTLQLTQKAINMGARFNIQRSSKKYTQLLFLLLIISGYNLLNAQEIKTIECFFDDDPGFENGITINTPDNTGTFTESFNLPIASLSQGFHSLFVRVQDVNSVWSLYDQKPFYVFSTTSTNNINTMEYWFNTDPGQGNATTIAVNGGFSPEFTQNTAIPLSNLALGFNTLNIRARNANGTWGLYDQTSFFVLENPGTANTISNLAALEYWFDNDPGFDNGTAIAVSGNPATLTENPVIPITVLSQGFHTLNVRAKNTDNTWGLYDQTSFFVLQNTGTASDIANLSTLEYWFDDDPGFGNGTSLNFAGDPAEVTAQDRVIPLTGLAPGFHSLGIRARNTDDTWSLLGKRQFYIFKADANTISPIVEELEFSAGEELVFDTGQTVPITATGNPDEFVAEIPESMLKCGTQNIWISLKNTNGNYALYNILVDIEAQNTDLPPEIIVFNTIEVELDENGQGALTIDDVDNGTNDCDLESVFITPSTPTYNCSNLGTNVITITARDEAGMESSEAVFFEVVDNLEPTVIAQDITVQLDQNGTVTITPAEIDNGSTDNCTIDTMSLYADTFTIPGTYPVTLTVTDSSNNSNSETVIVTVENNSLSTDDFSLSLKNINLYPIPTEYILFIDTDVIIDGLKVYDFNGKELYSITNNTSQINVSDLSSGVYLIEFKAGNATATKRFIKK